MPTRSDFFQKTAALLRSPLLAWPAWLRLIALLPVLALLWLGVAWALGGAAP